MKYKNGKEAKDGDPVVGTIGLGTARPRIVAGKLRISETGNHSLAIAKDGGEERHAVAIGDLLHADDAAKSDAAKAPAKPAAAS